MDQEIKYRVTADTKEAKEAFGELNKEVDEGKTVADKTGDSIGMLSSLIGVGLVAGIAVASSALLGLAKDYLALDGEVKNLTSSLKEHWSELFKANEEWMKFSESISKFSVAQTIESIRALNEEIDDLGYLQDVFDLSWTGLVDIQGNINKLKEEVRLLNNELYKTPKILGWKDVPKEMQDKWKESFKSTRQEISETEKAYIKWIETVRRMNDRESSSSPLNASSLSLGGRGRSPLTAAGNGGAVGAFSKGYIENLALMEDLTKSSANVLRSEFSSAWQDIFGEANSLFEKFMMNIAEQLANRAINSLFGGLLNLILPGAGILAGGALSPSNQPIYNQINIDGRAVATIYTKGRSEAGRLRMS